MENLTTDPHFNQPRPASTNATATLNRSEVGGASGVSKIYGEGDNQVVALDNVDVTFTQGEFTAIMGPSGSGKSTLMHCLAGLDRPTGGQVRIGTSNLETLNEKRLTELRRDKIGFVFQAFNLVPTLNAAENIVLPMRLAGTNPDPVWLEKVIAAVGLEQRLNHKPEQLSGGQQQRVAVARALASQPEIIFADEPTGNCDSVTSSEILGFMRMAVDDLNQTIVMVTHDVSAASYADRVLFLADGALVQSLENPTPDSVLTCLRTLTA